VRPLRSFKVFTPSTSTVIDSPADIANSSKTVRYDSDLSISSVAVKVRPGAPGKFNHEGYTLNAHVNVHEFWAF